MFRAVPPTLLLVAGLCACAPWASRTETLADTSSSITPADPQPVASTPEVVPAEAPSSDDETVAAAGTDVPVPAPELTAIPEHLPVVPAAPTRSPEQLRADELLASLTLEQKVGQLMMVGFGGTEADDSIEALVRGKQVGGVCLFKRNIDGPEQVARLNDQLRSMMRDQIPPFIAVDQEGGNVVRIFDGAVVLPGNMALGATGSPELAYRAGRAQAEDLLRLGFNMNLAPVLDVNVNPNNPVIGIRSFGDQPELVAQFGADYVRGQQELNLVTVAKHFPGHGSTDEDSHRALPVMPDSRADLMEQLRPFKAAFAEGLDGVMTAHIAVPSVTGSDVPATLSPELLGKMLREELKFDGLVITDELEMEAIADRYGVGKAAVLAIQAGADMVLIPWRPEKKEEVHRALLAAARSGELSAETLDAAVRRILTVKVRRGLFREPLPLLVRLAELQQRDQDQVAKAIAEASVTLLRSQGGHFPLDRNQRIGVITAEGSLGKAIWRRAPDANILVVPAYPNSARRARLRVQARELARKSELIVVGVINSRQLELVTLAAATGKPVVVVSMGLPYLASDMDEAKAVLAVYSYRRVSAEAAAAALFGEQGTPGRLPVNLGQYKAGHGLDPVGEALRSEKSGVREDSLGAPLRSKVSGGVLGDDVLPAANVAKSSAAVR